MKQLQQWKCAGQYCTQILNEVDYSPRTRYCKTCAKKRRQKTNRKYYHGLRNCKHCGESFNPIYSPRNDYCSDKCAELKQKQQFYNSHRVRKTLPKQILNIENEILKTKNELIKLENKRIEKLVELEILRGKTK